MTGKLPNPSGKYSVGCTDILPSAGKESVLFRLFYPTSDFTPTDENLTPWVKESEYVDGYSILIGLKWLRWNMKKLIGNEKIPVCWEPPLLPQNDDEDEKFPIVIFSHGIGGNRTGNSFICYDIASHGFMVASIEHRDLTASATFYIDDEITLVKKWMYILTTDGEFLPHTNILRNMQIMKRRKECSQCLDYIKKLNKGELSNILSDFDFKTFEDRLDLNQVIMAGHSAGATTALMTLKDDTRFKVGIFLDAWMDPIAPDMCESLYEKNIKQPMLFVNSENFQEQKTIAMIRLISAQNPETKKIMKYNGSVHQSFSDFSMILPHMVAKQIKFAGTTDQQLLNKATISTILRFVGNAFDLSSKGDMKALSNEYDFIVDDFSFKIDKTVSVEDIDGGGD